MPSAAPAPSPRRLPAGRFALLSWACWLAAVTSLWLQDWLGVYDTRTLLWLPFALAGTLAAVVGLALGIIGLVRGPRRGATFGRGVLGLGPVLAVAWLALSMVAEQGRRSLPHGPAHRVGRMGAVTLLELHAAWKYPGRHATERLIQYHGAEVGDPAGDAAAMAEHLARLEALLGRKQHSPIRWVRGGALGMGSLSLHSVALTASGSPPTWLDRHELAHAFLHQFCRPDADPPALLLEGFATAVDGRADPGGSLARVALSARAPFAHRRGARPGECLRSLLQTDYHVAAPEAYEFGGAFVEYLLREFGAEAFLALHNGMHPETLDADYRRALGIDFAELERRFWADAECRVGGK